MAQLHKKFTDDQVIELLKKYLRKEVGRRYIQEILGINKTTRAIRVRSLLLTFLWANKK